MAIADLSVLIVARREEWLARTIQDVLAARHARTEIICVLDGDWADPAIEDDPDVQLIYRPAPIGQRAAVNLAARLSHAPFLMKLDAHCRMAEGFDARLIEDYREGQVVVPAQYNLHVFDWRCGGGVRSYPGPEP